jgi:hypothetical protein
MTDKSKYDINTPEWDMEVEIENQNIYIKLLESTIQFIMNNSKEGSFDSKEISIMLNEDNICFDKVSIIRSYLSLIHSRSKSLFFKSCFRGGEKR